MKPDLRALAAAATAFDTAWGDRVNAGSGSEIPSESGNRSGPPRARLTEALREEPGPHGALPQKGRDAAMQLRSS
jgi:hypothetical protein